MQKAYNHLQDNLNAETDFIHPPQLKYNMCHQCDNWQ